MKEYKTTHLILTKKYFSDSDSIFEREMGNKLTDLDKSKKVADHLIDKLFASGQMKDGKVIVKISTVENISQFLPQEISKGGYSKNIMDKGISLAKTRLKK